MPQRAPAGLNGGARPMSWSLRVLADAERGATCGGRERSGDIHVPVLLSWLGSREADGIDLKLPGGESVRCRGYDQPARFALEYAGRTGGRAGQNQGQDFVRS